MKKYYIALLLLILVLAGYSQSEKTIKNLGVNSKEIWVNLNSKTKYLETLEKFDKEGNLTEEIKYNSDKSVKRYTRWTYNECNEILTVAEYNADNKIISRIEYTYDCKLRLSRKEYNEKGKLISWKTYKYDYSK